MADERPDSRDHHDHHPIDMPGCLWWVVRALSCSVLLYALMFAAILIMALIGLILY